MPAETIITVCHLTFVRLTGLGSAKVILKINQTKVFYSLYILCMVFRYNGGEAEKIIGRFTPCRDPDKVQVFLR